jgi:hypothetical protein
VSVSVTAAVPCGRSSHLPYGFQCTCSSVDESAWLRTTRSGVRVPLGAPCSGVRTTNDPSEGTPRGFESRSLRHAAIAQSGRALSWYERGREFNSLLWLHAFKAFLVMRGLRTAENRVRFLVGALGGHRNSPPLLTRGGAGTGPALCPPCSGPCSSMDESDGFLNRRFGFDSRWGRWATLRTNDLRGVEDTIHKSARPISDRVSGVVAHRQELGTKGGKARVENRESREHGQSTNRRRLLWLRYL